jgi:hypothetical protein
MSGRAPRAGPSSLQLANSAAAAARASSQALRRDGAAYEQMRGSFMGAPEDAALLKMHDPIVGRGPYSKLTDEFHGKFMHAFR